MKLTRLAGAASALAIALTLAGPGVPASVAAKQVEMLDLLPTTVGTAHQHHCGTAVLSTPGTECQGFAGREILTDPGLFVVGYENNANVGEKHVYQAVAAFDLAPLPARPEPASISKATLTYTEASTARRSPAGESQYGILPTCNTQLGVAADGEGGGLDHLVPSRPAGVAGVTPATTAESGAWDVTPQLRLWLGVGANQGALILRGDDESLDVQGLAMCLSYVFDLRLTVEYTLPG
ncbi:MAG TPA: hypothetical protein VEQ11_06235 [Chloroflexota bacterium]|nr:hypothetical protein [Chloroflexota bacterium]